MRVIRKSVFETNSSSTHSICISKEDVNQFPKSIHFGFGEFGWENDEVYNTQDYLYTAIMELEMYDCVDKIKAILDKHHISYTFAEKVDSGYWDQGYVDHAEELSDFINDVCNNENKLLRYLFGDSVIYTGNDNSCKSTDLCNSADDTIYDYETNTSLPNPNHDEEHYEYYYKGN